MLNDVIPPRPLRAVKSQPGAAAFLPPLLLRLPGAGGAVVVLVATGVPGPLVVRMQDKSGTPLASFPAEADVPVAAEVPAGTARIVVTGADVSAGAVGLGYYPVRGQFPAGRLLLKLHAFRNGAFATPEGSLKGLPSRWRQAEGAARHLGLSLIALSQTAQARLSLKRAQYQRFRAAFVEDFNEVPTPEVAPALVFLSAAGDGRSLKEIGACAQALKAQTDRSFSWIIAASAERLARDGDALAQAVGGTGHIVPAQEADEASLIKAALAASTAPDDGLICLLDLEGRPTRDAVALIRAAFAAHPDCQLLYTDEERCDASGTPLAGVFKPAFNRHLLEASPYMGALTVLRAGRSRALGIDPGFAAAAPYYLIVRTVVEVRAGAVRHLPRIAFSGPEHPPGFVDPETARLAAQALEGVLGVPVSVVPEAGTHFLRPDFPLPAVPPKVSIVIPTRDRAGLLGMAVDSLIGKTAYRNFEIIIVDNGSVEPETFALFAEIKATWPDTTIVRDDGDFNYPRICNNGVAVATGELILFLNNDIEVIEAGWLDEMVALASRPGVGIVGAKLLYPDRTIQHAGVMVGLFGYASHWFAHALPDTPGPEGRLLARQDVSAITGACQLIRKDVWDAIGPLDAERFQEDCNDIDLCLRARRAGHEVVTTPYALLIHHESASRGKARNKLHRERLKAQHERFDALWHVRTLVDPHSNPNLDRKNLFAALADAPQGSREARTDAI
ncbi:glycosyltransferase family 2 protein [Xanthobacter autotrophicus]|uniref:glycosyltransferase family 2 protein n=1 Tax=Xanthobacter autotrophicus TaxID=280 RepID=UPI0024A7490A|nr:glycosyltransferase family 2 protein [Xanthobacter autotrophicus]MDI4656081.1 glycosyltransferase family 2 protein [Xanthobacter autotrophicus]